MPDRSMSADHQRARIERTASNSSDAAASTSERRRSCESTSASRRCSTSSVAVSTSSGPPSESRLATFARGSSGSLFVPLRESGRPPDLACGLVHGLGGDADLDRSGRRDGGGDAVYRPERVSGLPDNGVRKFSRASEPPSMLSASLILLNVAVSTAAETIRVLSRESSSDRRVRRVAS